MSFKYNYFNNESIIIINYYKRILILYNEHKLKFYETHKSVIGNYSQY